MPSFAESIEPVTLENAHVRLEPLQTAHADALAELTVGTGLTRWLSNPLETLNTVDLFISTALTQAAAGQILPFVIIDKPSGTVAGSTRYLNIAAEHRRLEIGTTFVGKVWQRSPVNTAAKLLLLTHAFERLNCLRVELKTDSLNTVSRAAIARIGATEEGLLRRHMIRIDGTYRDTVYFSIIAEEWPAVKAKLAARLV